MSSLKTVRLVINMKCSEIAMGKKRFYFQNPSALAMCSESTIRITPSVKVKRQQ